jgi:hypothetical protein
VNGELNELNRCIVAHLQIGASWQRNLWQAHGARIGVLVGTKDLEWRYEGVAHVRWTTIPSLIPKAHVDVKEGRCVALEPAWLKGNGAAADGPKCPVS